MHTTNYYDTFIQVADDCPVTLAEVPPVKGDSKTVANIQFDMMAQHPYEFTSDDVIFGAYAIKNNISNTEKLTEREKYFSKGQACLRSSTLAKRYGWGIHNNADGKVAVFGLGSDEYEQLAQNKQLKQVKAMRSKRA
ncbi:hypothetical protein IM792_20095 [Mucilaginibacter sp. JRF]|uniref:DUF6157 family protein n=1 Tax=Mucilaginibacter sp. JRF TaxID=2780088 RepID=UPI00187E3E21|nr:DUF6157 family protein [Mucilaginibacter sp. JRF]MBE9586762.1 hypothetical protein [Mucilaginibacter sp. JRF]